MIFFRKLLTFPFNLVCFLLGMLGVVLIRSKEFAVRIDKRIDIFEEAKKKRKKHKRIK